MFNASTAVAVLRDVETVLASKLLTEDEKDALIDALEETLPAGLSFTPRHTLLVKGSIQRHRDGRTGKAEKSARKTEGVEDQAEVAEGRTEKGTKASGRKAKRVTEQAEDAGGVSGVDGEGVSSPTKA